ncbi:hypothetical protein NDU88_005249 [Pleurodeles waltl]|uniref:Uncharacterized protein n=1 Tax=Pleurodeles waltl TaxID=8319 RepID=A0AAV7M9F9_PLEWA|nr:hypothetical protein NDU88_005249 [Pleurodeles waltl]
MAEPPRDSGLAVARERPDDSVDRSPMTEWAPHTETGEGEVPAPSGSWDDPAGSPEETGARAVVTWSGCALDDAGVQGDQPCPEDRGR